MLTSTPGSHENSILRLIRSGWIRNKPRGFSLAKTVGTYVDPIKYIIRSGNFRTHNEDELKHALKVVERIIAMSEPPFPGDMVYIGISKRAEAEVRSQAPAVAKAIRLVPPVAVEVRINGRVVSRDPEHPEPNSKLRFGKALGDA